MSGEPEYHDQEIICQDCGKSFTFSAGEARFYASKLLSRPKRCAMCRKIRRAAIVPDMREEVGHEHA